MRWHKFGQYQTDTGEIKFGYKPGMGEVSMLGPLALLILVLAAGGGLYYWKKQKAKDYEWVEEEVPSKSEKIINQAAKAHS